MNRVDGQMSGLTWVVLIELPDRGEDLYRPSHQILTAKCAAGQSHEMLTYTVVVNRKREKWLVEKKGAHCLVLELLWALQKKNKTVESRTTWLPDVKRVLACGGRAQKSRKKSTKSQSLLQYSQTENTIIWISSENTLFLLRVEMCRLLTWRWYIFIIYKTDRKSRHTRYKSTDRI